MTERLFGIESEYAFTVLDPESEPGDRAQGLDRLFRLARLRLRHLLGAGVTDLYLASGARLYVDSGQHPEACTPECSNPWDAVRYVLAGERILGELLEELADESPGWQFLLFKCNVDYSGSQSTWGCHESYLHRRDPRRLSEEIIPHLVSRIVYTGAGGFRTGETSPTRGIEFMLSPRVAHLVCAISDSSTRGRGIFHTKDESLSSDGYHRLHVLCGESLCSQIASWLKVATTALVVAMVEAGLRPGAKVRLRDPLSAMTAFATDPHCQSRVPMLKGRGQTACQIQRHYLEQAETNVGAPFMPPWTQAVCRHWRDMLDRLDGAPQSVASSLDWAIKLTVFQDWARRSGVEWHSMARWSFVLNRMIRALGATQYKERSVSVEFVLGPRSPVADTVERLTPYIESHDMSWDQLRAFVDLRPALFEIDARFGQIGPESIFRQMDRRGVLDHAVSGVDNIEHAVVNPPAAGRARARGEWIARLAGSGSRYRCCWSRIVDPGNKRILDFEDPFTQQQDWQKVDAWHPSLDVGLAQAPLLRMLRMVRRDRAARGRPIEFRTGQRVFISLVPDNAPSDLIGRPAVVQSVGRDEQGAFYRLDADGGSRCWREEQLLGLPMDPDSAQA